MAGGSVPPRVVVVGDLAVDVVVAPAEPTRFATDVPGRVTLRRGGSAANAAVWMARTGGRVALVSAVGRDGIGRALVSDVRREGVTAHVARVARARTCRIGVLVAPGGERSFVADRGAADLLDPATLRPAWFAGASLLHMPAYSLLGEPLGRAGLRAAELAHAAGALVTVDLASVAPLLAGGRQRAHELVRRAAPDLLFATTAEASAVAGEPGPDALLRIAPVVVLKRGSKGATILLREPSPQRFDVATRPLVVTDTTGAGDAFDGGFVVAWLEGRRDGLAPAVALRRAALAGHRAAARHLAGPMPELRLG